MDSEKRSVEIQQDTHQPLLEAKYISIERRSPPDTVFITDDTLFRSAMPKPTHWSIGWSDLMMTMFILFLSMYVYASVNREFLGAEGLEVIGGDTGAALDSETFSDKGAPFEPLDSSLPLITGGSVKYTDSLSRQDIDKEHVSGEVNHQGYMPETPGTTESSQTDAKGQTLEEGEVRLTPRSIQVPRPKLIEEIFRLSREAIAVHDLSSLATVRLEENDTLRITLSADQLFETGGAQLTENARLQLEQLSTGLQMAPYMIHVVGHTDNVPIFTDAYTSNWDLSVGRASRVARFLIEDIGMPPSRFIVSGYASYRPVVPNTTAENRKKNRRVDIIIGNRVEQLSTP